MIEDDQILKCRDDKTPVVLTKLKDPTNAEEPFKLADGSSCSWLKKDETIGPAKLRQRIEPWLTALFQSEHLSLLVGSGLSNAIHKIATRKLLPGMGTVKFTYFDKEVKAEAKKSAKAAARRSGNVEDQIRVANELLRGLV